MHVPVTRLPFAHTVGIKNVASEREEEDAVELHCAGGGGGGGKLIKTLHLLHLYGRSQVTLLIVLPRKELVGIVARLFSSCEHIY